MLPMALLAGVFLASPANGAADPSAPPRCELEGRNFRLVLPTGSKVAISSADFMRLALGAECSPPQKPYDCRINLSRFNLNEQYGNHCRLIEGSPPAFDYYSLTMGSPEVEAFATATCYKVECQYGDESGGRKTVYDNASYCTSNPSERAIEKHAALRSLGFCR